MAYVRGNWGVATVAPAASWSPLAEWGPIRAPGRLSDHDKDQSPELFVLRVRIYLQCYRIRVSAPTAERFHLHRFVRVWCAWIEDPRDFFEGVPGMIIVFGILKRDSIARVSVLHGRLGREVLEKVATRNPRGASTTPRSGRLAAPCGCAGSTPSSGRRAGDRRVASTST